MAFDRADTDQLYDDVIASVLRRNGVVPVIINRRQDNRDINHQIIEQLDKCDFCIADLTYARPSVYFEAGYAQRQVEVIYTVRADHLGRGQPDDLRVHFDLQMKPLIMWESPTDSTFSKKLDLRLKSTVIKDFLRQTKQDEALKRERETFLSLPVNKRLEFMRRKCIYALRQMGFDSWTLHDYQYGMTTREQQFKNPAHLAGLESIFVARRKAKQTMQIVSIRASESITLRQLRQVGDLLAKSFFLFFGRPFEDELVKVHRTEEHHIVLSLRSTPDARVMSAMPYLRKENDRNRFTFEIPYTTTHYNRPSISLHRHVHLYFLSSITCESELKKVLGEVVKNI
jgi:nucleoside 2-deoxyribosyltransferase